MAKCKWAINNSCAHPKRELFFNDKLKYSYWSNRYCPKNTDWYCNIVKPKRKPKYKKIKAVAAINREGEVYSIRHEIDSDKWDKRVWKPCTILINAKYLKGEK